VKAPASPPNLVLVVIDALRHDALGPPDTPRERVRMPHLADLAARGVSFPNATAASSWTLPSMTSLLTGLQPSRHGLVVAQSRVQLVDAITTYAEILQQAYGYDTVAYTSGPWFMGTGRTILQGFHRTHEDFSLQDVEHELGQWAQVRDPARPFFLLLHTYDAHDPYGAANHPWRGEALPAVEDDPALVGPNAQPAEIFRRCFLDGGTTIALRNLMGRQRLADVLHRYAYGGFADEPRDDVASDLENAYWEGVRWTDGLLARTTAFLEGAGLLENTLYVVTADHGETFGAHGTLGHGLTLYDDLVQVPLVMVGPAPFSGGQVVGSGAALVDVIPTFLDWAGLEPLEGVEGRSMLASLDDPLPCRPVFSEERLTYVNTGRPQDSIRLSARTEQWKYVVTFDLRTGEAVEEVYDLLVDPDEQDDLAGSTGRLPKGLVFDTCFCEAVEAVRRRIWDDAEAHEERAAHMAYGVSNMPPTSPPPSPCGTSAE